MTKIYKQQFPWTASEVIIKDCMQILSCAVQDGKPTLWYAHSDKPDFEAPETVVFHKRVVIRMTGETYPLDMSFIGTLMTPDQSFVIHLFV